MMMNKLLVIFLAFITTIIFFQLNTGGAYAQETCTGTTCGGLCYDPATACPAGNSFSCNNNQASCTLTSCTSPSYPNRCGDTCYASCPSETNFYCSTPETGYVTTCCPQNTTCFFDNGQYFSCPADYPKYCSNTNQCISNSWDCNNYVQNCGGYTYYYCSAGSLAQCINNNPTCGLPDMDLSSGVCDGETIYCPAGNRVDCTTRSCAAYPYDYDLPAPIPGEVLDQQQLQLINGLQDKDSDAVQALAQTFTAGVSGNLSRIAFAIYKTDSPTGNITVSVVDTTSGTPTNSLLTDEVSIPVQQIPAGPSILDVRFTSKPLLTAGHTYAIRIDGNHTNRFNWFDGQLYPFHYPYSFSYSSDYSGGANWRQLNNGSWQQIIGDFKFGTYMTSSSEGVSPVSPTAAPTPTSVIGSCGIANMQINEGLITSPFLDREAGQTGGDSSATTKCIIDTKAQFAPFAIPTFRDLKSLYYDQKR